MSTRTAFTLVGAAVGYYLGNTALGATIGAYVGGVVDPVQVKGPRITDAQTQTSQDGVPIPITYGSVRIAGNIIASDKLIEHKKKDNGKGSGTETTTYTYTRTYAIGICEGPIYGILRVWRDAKLVYDARFKGLGDYNQMVANRQFLEKTTVYKGDETQVPNSTLQGIFGVDQVSAYRGLAYVVIKDDDLTDRAGSIPTYEFEVVQYGTSMDNGDYAAKEYANPRYRFPAMAGRELDSQNQSAVYEYGTWGFGSSGVDTWFPTLGGGLQDLAERIGRDSFDGELMGWTYDLIATGGLGGEGAQGGVAPAQVLTEPQNTTRVMMGRVYSQMNHGAEYFELDQSELTSELVDSGIFVYALHLGGLVMCGDIRPQSNPLGYQEQVMRLSDDRTFYFYPSLTLVQKALPSCITLPGSDWVQIPGTPDFYVDPSGTIHYVGGCVEQSGAFTQLRNEVTNGVNTTRFPQGPVMETSSPLNTREVWEIAYQQSVALGLAPPGWIYGADYPFAVSSACYCATDQLTQPDPPILAEIVSDICRRKGVQANEINVAQLTDTVLGFTVAAVTSAADAINALAPAYLFDESEYDGQIHFVKRGGPTLAALNEQDAFDSDDGRIIETRAQELELPRLMVLSYMDVDANYAVTTQSAERLSVSVASSGTDQVQLAVVMNADKAAQVADVLLKDKWSSINGTLELSVPECFSQLVPTDPVFLSYGEALFRTRVTKAENADGIIALSLQQDNADAYSSVAVGVPPRPGDEGQPNFPGPTFMEVMNLPALRDQDDRPGVYIAVNSPIGRWSGAQIDVSYDNGQTWTTVANALQPATLGLLGSPLAIWSEHIPDPFHEIDVALTAGDFESVTLAAMYAGVANALCIGDEIVQFQTQDTENEKDFILDGTVFRGRKNTSPDAWPAGTRVVALEDAYFIPLDRSRIGSTIQFRATTLGTDTQYGTVRSLDFTTPLSVQEWAPTNVRHKRDTLNNLRLDWSPRHRLGTSRMPYPSLYFTGYRLVFTNGTITKTIDTTNPYYDYSAASQTADFGSAGALSVSLYATNSIIGPGEGVTVTA